MWIVPRPLHTSHFALDTAALTSDCNELSEQCARSLLVRSSLTPARTWLRKWRRDSWTSHLSGRILRLSHGPSFTEKWTSSLEASLVSHLAPQGNEQVTMTPDTCSPTSSEDSESWGDLPLFSSKTWREYSAQSSTAPSGQTHKAPPFCSMSSASWSAWVIKQRQAYSARAKQAHPTSASACSYLVYEMTSPTRGALLFQDCSRTQVPEVRWATPNTMDTLPALHRHLTQGARAGRTESGNLREQVCVYPWQEPTSTPQDEEPRNTLGSLHESQSESANEGWRTPSTMEAKRTTYKSMEKLLAVEQGHQVSLTAQVQAGRWATPTAGTKNHEGGIEYYRRRAAIGKQVSLHGQVLHGPQDEEPRNTHGSPHESQSGSPTGQLNPRWVETLMGLPVGWTMVSCAAPWTIAPMNCGSSATELSPQPQSELSESSGSAWGTPQARDWKGPSGRAFKGTERDLPLQVRDHSAPRTK